MEEMLENVAAARQIYQRWMEWHPAIGAFSALMLFFFWRGFCCYNFFLPCLFVVFFLRGQSFFDMQIVEQN